MPKIQSKIKYRNFDRNSKAEELMIPLYSIDKNMDTNGVVSKMVEFGVSQIAVDNKIIDKDLLLEYIYHSNKEWNMVYWVKRQ